jgi:hypothetical protein
MPMRPLTLAFAICVFAAAVPARAAKQPAQPAAQEKPAPAAEAQNSGAGQKPDQPSAPGAAQKPAEKTEKLKKVITNEDIEGTGAALYPSSAGIDFNKINECDRFCVEQVRQAARIPPNASPEWKRTLLSGIEKVQADGDWQARLGGIARVRAKYCDLEKERNIEMARRNAPGVTLTPEEINLEELYARKFAALQRELVAAYERADATQRKYSGVVVQFIALQEQRVSSAVCVQAPPVYYSYPTGGDDDP